VEYGWSARLISPQVFGRGMHRIFCKIANGRGLTTVCREKRIGAAAMHQGRDVVRIGFLHFPPNRRIARTYCGQHTQYKKHYRIQNIITGAVIIVRVGHICIRRCRTQDAPYKRGEVDGVQSFAALGLKLVKQEDIAQIPRSACTAFGGGRIACA
jgi:hypothetical protein